MVSQEQRGDPGHDPPARDAAPALLAAPPGARHRLAALGRLRPARGAPHGAEAERPHRPRAAPPRDPRGGEARAGPRARGARVIASLLALALVLGAAWTLGGALTRALATDGGSPHALRLAAGLGAESLLLALAALAGAFAIGPFL